jgi:hypothetical protein
MHQIQLVQSYRTNVEFRSPEALLLDDGGFALMLLRKLVWVSSRLTTRAQEDAVYSQMWADRLRDS